MRFIRYVLPVVAALNLGASYAHVLELRPKRNMSGEDWLTTQQAYTDFGPVASVLLPAAIILGLIAAARTRHSRRTAAGYAVFVACSLVTVAIWAIFNEPVNNEIADWDPDNLPSNWENRRDTWEFAHATSAGLHLVGFISLLTAVLNGDKK